MFQVTSRVTPCFGGRDKLVQRSLRRRNSFSGYHLELLRDIGPQKASTVMTELHGKIIKKRWYGSKQRGYYIARGRYKSGWSAVLEAQNLYMACVAHNCDTVPFRD